jgi:hypothetical protein
MSISALSTLKSNWNYYTRSFTVQSGMDESKGNELGRIHKFGDSRSNNNNNNTVFFLTAGQQDAVFSWPDIRTLSQIEQMSGYKVKPSGVVSQFKHGGFVVYEENGHGLVAAITDLSDMDWNSAKTACDELILNGYSDWRLPSKEELNALYVNLRKLAFFGFSGKIYWSSTEDNSWRKQPWMQYFSVSYGGRTTSEPSPSNKYSVRAVRSF